MALIPFVLATLIMGQQVPPPRAPVFRTGTELVTLSATVTDAAGRNVVGLTKEDFTVEDNGLRQDIAFFGSGEDTPMSLVLAVDVSGSMEDKIDGVQDALTHLLARLKRDDEVAMITFHGDVNVVARFDEERNKVARAIRGLRPSGGTALYDAIGDALRLVATGRQPKRAVLLLTDGNDTASRRRVGEIVEAVVRSEAIVYCLGIGHGGRGSFGHGGSGGADEIDAATLRLFSDRTGGATYVLEQAHEAGRDRIDEAIAILSRELREQYTLGYYPTARDSGSRQLVVRARDSAYRVRSRSAIQAPADGR